jgi:hypothetical protein
MNYQEVSIDFEGVEQKHIWITNDDGSMKSFPADPDNPEYVRFLEALEATEPEAE